MPKRCRQFRFLPSEEKIKTLSRPEKIAYLNRWLMKARVLMYAPGILLIGISILGAIFMRYTSYNPIFAYCAIVAVLAPLISNLLVVSLTKSRLRRCVQTITEETWNDRTDIPALLGLLQGHIPFISWWAREQLAHATILHNQNLTGNERMDAIGTFSYYLQRFTASPHQTLNYRRIVQGLPLICEAMAEVGGRNEVTLLRSVTKCVIAGRYPAEIREPVENSLAKLEARLAREEAPDMLLRAGQMPDDGLLRAASNPQASSPDSLLRASRGEGSER